MDITVINVENPAQCQNCKSYVTRSFPQSGSSRICPFCNIPIESVPTLQTLFQNYYFDKTIGTIQNFLLFIFDLNCFEEQFEKIKNFIEVGLKSCLPAFGILFCYLTQTSISFCENFPKQTNGF